MYDSRSESAPKRSCSRSTGSPAATPIRTLSGLTHLGDDVRHATHESAISTLTFDAELLSNPASRSPPRRR
jgi:hypothetical protein